MKLFRFKKKRRPADSGPPRQRVIFVTHEASRTGAPKIILQLLRHFNQHCDIQCETIMLSGGSLATEFRSASKVNCFNLTAKASPELTKQVHKVVSREKNNPPVLAICNSMESRHVAAELASHGIPTISLVHELPSSYSEEDYATIFDASNEVIFPAAAVMDAAATRLVLPTEKSSVLPQGLLDPDFGTRINRDDAMTSIRSELSLPEDAFIVLGCGTLDLRKGIDHFANVARRTVDSNLSNRPIHFVWVGDGQRWAHSPYHYLQLDLERSPARDNVHFIGERSDVEPYFVGSDAFLMSSRVDPFPCVIHEAMAASLPVITFADSGGAPEAVADGAGFIVRYADYDQAASVIDMLATQPGVAEGVREKSRRRVAEKYRFEDYGDQLIAMSERLTGTVMRERTSFDRTDILPMTPAIDSADSVPFQSRVA